MGLQLAKIGELSEAARLEAAGEYSRACELLRYRWAGPGAEPRLEGLPETEQATLLLRAGSLTGWLGSQLQMHGAQETAKNLLSKAIRLLEESDDQYGVAEAEKCMAICYWREGAFDESRVLLNRAAARLSEHDD